MDANVTTFIVAVVLFAIGTGPVRGFAVTLALGVSNFGFDWCLPIPVPW